MSRLLPKNLIPFFSPDAPAGGGGNNAPAGGGSATVLPTGSGKEEMIEFLGGDDDQETIDLTPQSGKGKDKEKGKEKEKEDDETPPENDEQPDEELEEEVDELTELEQELEEPTEEQLELVTPVRRRDILKKYPSLFKDFPYLEKAYYREQQFTELLPTIEDAKQAVEAKTTLDNFEKDLMGGNSETILKAVKAQSPQSFNKIVDNYLGTLRNVDEKAYFHVIGNTIKHTITAMVQEARTQNNEQLQNAALLLNQFVFGSSNFVPPTTLSQPERPEDKSKERELSEREQAHVRQQFDNTRVDLNSRVNNTLRNTIAAHIDPKQSMTDYVRRNAERDALESLESLMSKDSRFKTLADRLWEAAFKDGFSRDSVERIKSAYLSKAKTLLPSVIKKARNDALRGMGKRVVEDSENPDATTGKDKRGPVPSGRPRSQTPNAGKITDPKDIPRGMRTIDFLNS